MRMWYPQYGIRPSYCSTVSPTSLSRHVGITKYNSFSCMRITLRRILPHGRIGVIGEPDDSPARATSPGFHQSPPANVASGPSVGSPPGRDTNRCEPWFLPGSHPPGHENAFRSEEHTSELQSLRH